LFLFLDLTYTRNNLFLTIKWLSCSVLDLTCFHLAGYLLWSLVYSWFKTVFVKISGNGSWCFGNTWNPLSSWASFVRSLKMHIVF
jgi:hypothetical protein